MITVNRCLKTLQRLRVFHLQFATTIADNSRATLLLSEWQMVIELMGHINEHAQIGPDLLRNLLGIVLCGRCSSTA